MKFDEAGLPLQIDEIEDSARALRKNLGLSELDIFNIVDLLENDMVKTIPDFVFQSQPAEVLGRVEAYARFHPPAIFARSDVYLLAKSNQARARFTLAHEIGHLWLHTGSHPRMPGQRSKSIRRTRSVEAQADAFAAFFLMPRAMVTRFDDPRSLADHCKVNVQAAQIQMDACGWPDKRDEIILKFQTLLAELNERLKKKL